MTTSSYPDGKPILNLPARTVEIVKCEFNSEEKIFYDTLAERIQKAFEKVS